MKLVVIAAVIAVCGGAKLDRTYLPPASAKSAGGSPGSLQTPFAGNSFNNGLGGLPKGSYSNDFQGVVVDAAVGTRTSEGDSGLGAPRAAYGSPNSKVGEAAFRPTFGAGFRHTDADGSLGDHQDSFNGNQHSFGDNHADGLAAGSHAVPERPERPQAVLERAANTIRLESEVGPENYHYAYETDNGIYAEENAVATNGVQAQGGYSYTADDGQVYSVTYTADEGGYQPKGDHLPTPPPIPEEILKSLELNAQEEAAGIVDDGSYDAHKYNARGDYSQSDNANNQYNERQSSKGKPVNRHESDAVTSGSFINQSNQPFRRPNESSASNGPNEIPEQNVHKQDGNVQKPTSSNGFGSSNRFTSIAQAQSGPLDNGIKNQKPAFGNGFGSSNRFAANGQTGQVSNAASGNGYNSNNEYLPPGNSRPVNLNRKPKPEELELSTDTSAAPSFNQEYNAKPQSSAPESQAFPKGQSNGQYQSQTAESNAAFGSPSNRPTSISSPSNLNKDGFNHIGNNNVNKKEVSSHSSQNSNEYLPPQNSFNRPANQGLRLQQNQPVNSVGSGFNVKSASSDQKNTQPGENFGKFSSASASFTSNGHQPSEQLTNGNINGQRYQQPGNNVAPSYNTFNSQKSTIQPQTELTTPFEYNEKPSNKDHSFEGAYQTTRKPTSLSLQPLNNNPSQSQFISQSADQSQAISSASTAVHLRPQISQSQSFSHAQNPNSVNPARLPQIPGQFQSFGNKQRPSQNQAAPEDAQIAASTIRPSITPAFVQRQGQDDSYYYNQPARPFNTPQSQTQGSRFPNTPSNNFNNLNRQGFTAQSNSQYSSAPQFGSAQSPQTDLSQTSPKYPQESNLASVAPTSANKQISAESSAQFGPQSTRFQSPQNSFSQGSSRYPQPPSLLPVGSTSPTKKESSSPVNGVTQASASPFGGSPTPSTSFNNKQFGQFSSRPSNQNQFSHSSSQQLSQESPLPSNRPSSQLQSNSRNQFNQKLASQSQSQSFGQRPSSQQPSAQRPFSQRPSGQPSGNAQPEPSDNSPAVATQQYSGQIYEYNKPSQILPAPAHKEPSASSSQFGQKVNSQPSQSHPDQPQGSDDSINSASSQNTVQANQPFAGQSPRPQFGAQPSKPQFGVQPSKPQFAQPSRPQFSAQASSQFNAQPSRPQFVAQSSFSSNAAAQEENSPVQGSHPQVNQDQRQQNSCCGQKHIGQDSSAQPTQASAFSSINGQGSSEATAEVNNGFAQGPSFRPEQAGSQSFAGRGEQFGGPRVPPSFDEKTGYHY